MRKLIIAALMAATLAPVSAYAQSNQELRHDRRDIRDEQRDLRDAKRSGDPRAVRDERHDVRDARQEYREDVRDRKDNRADDRGREWRRDDWRGWRDRNPATYNRGTWRAPFRYTAFRTGARISAGYYGPRYIIADPWRYHLPRAGYAQQWVRHYDDAILVDVRRGIVIDVIRGLYR